MLPLETDVAITIVRAATATGYGNSRTVDWNAAARTTVVGSVQPQSSSETTGGRDQATVSCPGLLPGTADVLVTDRIEWNGAVWEVDGAPDRWPDPFTPGEIHHIELTMTRTR